MAFEVASTNLVLELGIIVVIVLGWQFTVGEFVGRAVDDRDPRDPISPFPDAAAARGGAPPRLQADRGSRVDGGSR